MQLTIDMGAACMSRPQLKSNCLPALLRAAAVAEAHGHELDVQELIDAVFALFSPEAALRSMMPSSCGQRAKADVALQLTKVLCRQSAVENSVCISVDSSCWAR